MMMMNLCKKAPNKDGEYLIRGCCGPGRGKQPKLEGREKEITLVDSHERGQDDAGSKGIGGRKWRRSQQKMTRRDLATGV